MLTTEQNDLLCRVENGAPMGALMKRYWMPACLASEVAAPGGAPLRSRLLGEDLVIFRAPDGRLGALDEYCPHRGVSLALARNEDCGLRCLYHGWTFDVDGRIVEMPTEPPTSRAAEHLRHGAYPVRESCGMVWVYLGPAEHMPEFQSPPWASCEGRRLFVYKSRCEANWTHALEGQIDSAHSSSLHSSNIRAGKSERTVVDDRGAGIRPSGERSPRLHVKRTSYGMRYVAIRRPEGDADTHDYMRVTVFIAPCFALIPPNNRRALCNMAVPRDDGTTMVYYARYSDVADVDGDAILAASGMRPGIDLDAEYRKTRTRENNFQQDRAAMDDDSFSGIYGIANQDMAMWETMGRGPIVDRTREHLGSTDVAIVQFRRLLLDAVEVFQRSGQVLGQSGAQVPLAKVQAFEGLMPSGADWEMLGLSDEERVLAAE